MASFNKAILMGHLGKDPETRYTQGGKAVTNFSIATSRVYKNASGEKVEDTTWHNITCWERQAEIAGEYLKKGSPVLVEGEITQQTWEKDGEKHYKTVINASRITLMGTKTDGERRERDAEPERAAPEGSGTRKPAKSNVDDLDDDIPF